uniref:DUF6824 domain-containing protein n=1 Tax=Ditylum brightwellii TaxID=49249 RepID=A0A7S1ZNQ2_9STRA|mmetsp:Transcript_35706/g.53214  ORF Transcript_35706/g.53214 Transcript_35706/m.53214 type:complete len:173 (+) Transcript_35706:96-614(+)
MRLTSSDWIDDYKKSHTDDIDFPAVFSDVLNGVEPAQASKAKKNKPDADASHPPARVGNNIEPCNQATNCIPTEKDVLFGRGGKGNHHPGNKEYRAFVKDLKEQYTRSSKAEKTALSKSIIDYIKSSGGRFLMQDENDGWYEATNQAARKKVSQAFREAERIKNRPKRRKNA